jgi:hypothetical protein
MIVTSDGVNWNPTTEKLVGSVSKKNSREVHKPAMLGEYPVFVEQSGSYRMFTYNKKLVSV